MTFSVVSEKMCPIRRLSYKLFSVSQKGLRWGENVELYGKAGLTLITRDRGRAGNVQGREQPTYHFGTSSGKGCEDSLQKKKRTGLGKWVTRSEFFKKQRKGKVKKGNY